MSVINSKINSCLVATRGFELVTHGFELVTRGFKLVTRNSCFTFPRFLSIYEFKFTSFLILAISKHGDSYKLLQRQKIQARGNKTIAGTKTNKNNAVKIKDKETKKSTCHGDPATIFLANFRVDFPTEFSLITGLLELSAPLIRSSFYPDSFL